MKQSPPPGQSTTGATVLGLGAIVFWSTLIACSRSVTEQLGTFTGGAVIYLAAGLIGCGHLIVTGRLGRLLRQSDRRYLIGCGGAMAAYTFLLFLAIGSARTREQVITVTVVNYLWPSLTLMFALPMLGWRASPVKLAAGTALAMIGVALAIGVGEAGDPMDWSWHAHATTTLPALLAAVSWALYSNWGRLWGTQGSGGAMPLFLLATGLLLLGVRFTRAEESAWTGGALWEVGYLVIFPTLLAYVFWDIAARRGDLALVASASYLTPLLSVWVSGLYLGVPITAGQWVGGVLVVAGAVLCRLAVLRNGSAGGE